MKREARSTKSEASFQKRTGRPRAYFRFQISDLGFRTSTREPGITLLLVILILSALLSISLGIIDVVLGEFRISGEITDSFVALYAADQGMEKMLYDDRISDSICPSGNCVYGPVTTTLSNGACHILRLNRSGSNTTVTATGEYKCGSSALSVKRAFESTYTRNATSTPPPAPPPPPGTPPPPPPPQTLLADGFGTGSSENDIPNWEEEGSDNSADAQARAAGSGDDGASPDGGRFAAIGGGEWICRSVNASGFNTLVLAYYWRGDPDAEDGETGIAEHRVGGDCESGSGWTVGASHELDDGNAGSSAWSSLQSINLPSSLNNTSFFLRFRNTANSGNEDFRVDAVTVTGVPN